MRCTSLFLLTCAVLLMLVLPRFAQSQAATGVALSNAAAQYARVLRLSHNSNSSLNGAIVVSVNTHPASGAEVDIYSSADGLQFKKIGLISDSSMVAGGLCCGTLFELPSQVGSLAPGTLLWSGSVGQKSTTQPMQLEIYSSSDQGYTWSHLSNCATGATPGSTSGGIWEPQFTVAADGALVCFYSDEQQAGHSQLLHQVRSYDGLNWQDSSFTVASTIQADRPGMAVVTRLPSGTYFMSYELCGPAACTVFFRTSLDGWNWGDPTNMGTKVVTGAGQWFEHAPTNAWAPSATSPNGTILLVGQMMYDSNGQVSSGNGVTIFTNHSADGSGPWGTMPAPVEVPNAYNNPCPNYSSPLLPSVDGQSVLQFASAYLGTVCEMYYATGPILAGTVTPVVSVTPTSGNVGSGQPISVIVQVSGASGITPVGTVTITVGAYTSSAVTLSDGSASLTIPANAVSAGTVTLTANYSGDANYLAGTGTASVAVAQSATFQISAPSVTVTAGASSGNTVQVTVTPESGFSGSVALSAQITSAPAGSSLYYPTLSFNSSAPLVLSGSSPATATLTIHTVASGAAGSSMLRGVKVGRQSNPVYFGLLVFFAPFLSRSRRRCLDRRLLLLISVMVCAFAIAGCGGGSAASTSPVSSGTLPGNYTVAVTGTSASISATASFTLTVQ